MASLVDLLADSAQKEKLLTVAVQEGTVFRMHLGKEEGVVDKHEGDDGRNKYFVVVGHDAEGNAIGFVLIDTEINPYLPQCRKDLHYPLRADKYDFLKGKSRFVDCSDFKIIEHNKFSAMFGPHAMKGQIDAEDVSLIRDAIASYKNASPKHLKRFGLK